MKLDEVKGDWTQFAGKVKEKWGLLTDNDLMVAEGHFDQLVGALQKEYGLEKEQAQIELERLYRAFCGN